MIVNPFAGVGQIAIGPRFVRRSDAANFLGSVWSAERPGNASITGNYRVGKSSIVRNAAVEHSLEYPGHFVVLSNAGRVGGAIDLLRTVGRRIFGLLKATDQPLALQRSCMGCLSTAMEFDDWFGVSEALGDLFRLLRDGDIGVLLIIDEFDRVGPWFELAGFQLLRDLASEPEFSLGLTTVSRRSVYDIEISGCGGSILGGVLSNVYNVELLEDEEAEIFFAKGSAALARFGEHHADVHSLAGTHPFLLDLACYWYMESFRTSDFQVIYRLRPQYDALYNSYLVDLESTSGGQVQAAASLLTEGRDLSSLEGETKYMLASALIAREGTRRMLPFSQDFAEYWKNFRPEVQL